LRFLQATAESGRGLCFVYIISLFTFESSINISLITIYLYKKYIFFPYKQQLEIHRKEANLTENHTTPMVSVFAIHTKQTINEENSSLFMNSIL
jgi:hypothetical protein